MIARVLRDLKLRRVEVPRRFPLGLAIELDGLGVRLDLVDDPFWPEREKKRPDEIRAITEALRAAEAGLEAGLDALRACRVGRDGWLRKGGRRFTAEDLRAAVNTRIMARGLRAVAHHLRAGRPGGGSARGGARAHPRAHAGRDGHLPALRAHRATSAT